MKLPPFLRATPDGVQLAVKLQPRASVNEIAEAIGDELKIKVTAPPVDSAANQSLVELLADILDCPRSAVRLIRGQTSRHKTIFITGIAAEKITERIERAVGR